MRGIDLADLMGEMTLVPGTWFHLLDEDTQFSQTRKRHPYVFPDGWNAAGRRALAHALPRSTSKPYESEIDGVDYLKHDPHGAHDGRQCALDQTGFIPPRRFPVPQAWINRGELICEERSSTVLGRIQTFDMERAK